ncbi:MAG: sel1 repeat family protein [Gammaproteobacteria bacterium]|nr:sel1 repeat family protein [Gammaproteobacteria bacterium]
MDKRQARQLYAKACDKGDANGCFNLGNMHYKGEGGPVNERQARQLLAKACDKGDAGGCFNLGNMHYKGEGGPVNKYAAPILFEQACVTGRAADACKSLEFMKRNGEGKRPRLY